MVAAGPHPSPTGARLVAESTATLAGMPGPAPVNEVLAPLARSVVTIVSGAQPWLRSSNGATAVRVAVFSSSPPAIGWVRPASAADVSNSGENVLARMSDGDTGHLPLATSKKRDAPVAAT